MAWRDFEISNLTFGAKNAKRGVVVLRISTEGAQSRTSQRTGLDSPPRHFRTFAGVRFQENGSVLISTDPSE